MLRLRLVLACVLPLLLGYGLAIPMVAQSLNSQKRVASESPSYWNDPTNWIQQFVPDSRPFWDNSKNWTSNYGPAYRDTLESPSQMLACSTQFALCFHSGAEPYPCTLSPDGRSANCLCTVATTTNYTLIDAILNYPVYVATVQACCPDGSGCPGVGQAPVCNYLNGGTLIPGANVISTYDPGSRSAILAAFASTKPAVTVCPKGPYAACMTAPCQLNADGSTANCKCPVFYGKFQLVGSSAQCSLGGDLVPSASYIPQLDNQQTGK
ncbi:MAG: hypothetical protein WCC92_02625 [Candidatus Korobacteraceae bacterium]